MSSRRIMVARCHARRRGGTRLTSTATPGCPYPGLSSPL
jgi:hypothetical protein